MLIDYSGQKALVTGGTRGIGKSIALTLAELGADVIATGTEAKSFLKLQDEAHSAGLKIRYESLDCADHTATEKFADRMALEDIDVLINNAGINYHSSTGEIDLKHFDQLQSVNVRAPVVLCRAIAPKMAQRKYGRIINISSIFSTVSRPGRVSYTMSKFALVGLTLSVALDYAKDGVLANSLGPGFIDTEMTRRMLGDAEIRELVSQVPIGRLGTVKEIADAVAFLASSANGFITGQNIIADGGFTCM